MNSEEKILEMLGQINTRLDGLERGQARLEESQARFEESQARFEQSQTRLEEGQAKLENTMLRFESEYIPLTKAAKEGFESVRERNQDHDKRLTKLEHKSEKHDGEIGALRIVVGQR